MRCRTLNRRGLTAPFLHRLWCPACRRAQDIDAMIGFGITQLKDEPIAPQGLNATLGVLDMENGGRQVRRASRRLARRWLLRQARRVGVAAVVGLAWWQYMNYIPAMHIPPKTAPDPNAFTYFKAASLKTVYSKEVGEAQGKPDKAAKPGPMIDRIETVEGPEGSTGPRRQVHRIFDNNHLYTLADKKMLLAKNQDALTTLRAGFRYPYGENYVRSWNTMFPHFAQFRAMARLLNLEASVKAEEGDWNGSLQSSLDAMQMGSMMTNGGSLIGRLVGIACEAIGRKRAWAAVEHLDAKQARAAIARLEHIRALYAPFSAAMQEEEWFMQESLSHEMRKPGWRVSIFQMTGNTDNPKLAAMALLGWSNRIVLKDVTEFMDQQVARSKMPYQQAKKLPEIKEPFDPVAQMMMPVFSQAQFQDISMQTQDALLETAVALRAYRLEHGDYPEHSLLQLTPEYLPQVPTDLFAQKALLSYFKLSPEQAKSVDAWMSGRHRTNLLGPVPYVLYSVGPDGVGDGGDPIDELKRPRPGYEQANPKPRPEDESRFNVRSDSVGDILAGINTH